MGFWCELVGWEVVTGEPVRWGESVLLPESRALVLRLPWGGLVWHRPVAVRVERNGQTERIPIHDTTRIAQLVLAGASLICLVAALAANTRSRQKEKLS